MLVRDVNHLKSNSRGWEGGIFSTMIFFWTRKVEINFLWTLHIFYFKENVMAVSFQNFHLEIFFSFAFAAIPSLF